MNSDWYHTVKVLCVKGLYIVLPVEVVILVQKCISGTPKHVHTCNCIWTRHFKCSLSIEQTYDSLFLCFNTGFPSSLECLEFLVHPWKKSRILQHGLKSLEF